MYLYEKIVSESVRSRRMAELKNFADNRISEHADYFAGNQIISTSLAFVKKLVDNQL